MERDFKCWRKVSGSNVVGQRCFSIGTDAYVFQNATEEEAETGARCLNEWYVERRYKTQIAGLGRIYYDMRSEMQELHFEELIFNDGECIGAYHDEIVFLFNDEKTHYAEKYLGEMPTGPDQGIAFYDYYYLHSK